MKGNTMSGKNQGNIGNITGPRNTNLGGSGGSSSLLQGARAITNITSGQEVQQKNIQRPAEVKKILTPMLVNLGTVGTHMDTAVPLLNEACAIRDVANKDSAHYTRRSQIGTQLAKIYDDALAECDLAIAEAKKINPAVKLSKCGVPGLVDTLTKLSISDTGATAGKLLNRLIEIRGQTYDSKVSAEAWTDLAEGMLKSFSANNQSNFIANIRQGKTADEILNSHEDQIAVKVYLKWVQLCQDKFESCVKRLANGSAEMPDRQLASGVFANAIGNLFKMRATLLEDRERVQYNIAGGDYASALISHKDNLGKGQLTTDEEKSKSIDSVVDKAGKASKLGLDALQYISQSIDFHGEAIARNAYFDAEGKRQMLEAKEELHQASADYLHNVFNMHCTALGLAMEHPSAQYKTELMESMERLTDTEIELAVLHEACCETMKVALKDESKLKVPEHLLHHVLKDLAEKYEDLQHQCNYVLEGFKKVGETVENNKKVVEHIQGYADAIAKMQEMIDSQLARVDEAGISQKPKGKNAAQWAQEARDWVNDALMEKFPNRYAANVEDDVLAEQTEELSIVGEEIIVEQPTKPLSESSAAQIKKGPTPAKIVDPAKALEKAVSAAEKSETKAAEKLEKLEKDSRKYSFYARSGEKEGFSPCTVEMYMKLAATQETRLANKKRQIAENFKNAIEMMPLNDSRREEYGSKVKELNAQATKHMEDCDKFLTEGKSLRINMSKKLPPTHSLFHYLHEQKEISGVARTERRKPLNRVDESGKFRKDPRTNENIVDYIDEYTITLKGGKKFVAHFHYRSPDAKNEEIAACHFKTMEQKKLGARYVLREAEQGRDVEVYRAKTNAETLQVLTKLSAKGG